MIEYNCQICNKYVRKVWSASMSGTPRYCSRDCKAEAQRRSKPVDRDWLYQKYIIEGMDTTQIAALVQRDPKSVWNWLKGYDIPTRGRGTTGNGRYTRGKPRHVSPEVRQRMSEQAREARKKNPSLPHLIGGKHHLKGKRGADTPNWKGGATPERQAFYSSEEWKIAVKAIWKRDDATCQRCGKHHNTVNNRGTFDIHHIVSFAIRELRCELSNLVLLCEDCHRWVHNRANTQKEYLR